MYLEVQNAWDVNSEVNTHVSDAGAQTEPHGLF